MQQSDARASQLVDLAECRIRPEVNEALAAEIRAVLARQNLNQTDLAQRLGWTQVKVSRRLRSVGQFRTGELAEICAALDVSLADLLAEAS